jgi:hypothetical protein
VDTSGYGGRELTKKVTVQTNDPKKPIAYFTIQGQVEKIATITPARILLKGPAGFPIKGTARIVPEKKYPFSLSEITDAKGENIQYSIEKLKANPTDEYLVTVVNTQGKKGRYYETLRIPTDLDKVPEIKIWIYGDLTESLPGKKN